MKNAMVNTGRTDEHQKENPKKITRITPDVTLWNSFRDGNENALESLFEQFSGPLYNYGKKILRDEEVVKDAIQELFIELWRLRNSIGETHFIKFYLFKALRRKIIRTKMKVEKGFFTSLTNDYDLEIEPSHEFILVAEQHSRDKKEALLRLLNRLTKRQREAIFLRYFDAMTYEQIAEIMEVNKQTVYNLIHDAIAQLRKVAKML